ETLMGQKDVPMTNLVKNAMNFVTFPSPISIHGNYFISCKFSYSTASDTFALYHAQPRGIGKLNTSYCRLGNSWFMLPEKAGRDFTTSLLIQSMPCDVVAAEIGDTVQVQPFKWSIDSKLHLLNVVSSSSVITDIHVYNLLGQSMRCDVVNNSSQNYQIDLSNLVTGVYIANVKTKATSYSFKFSYIRHY
ncbi:MAG: T9SS type A sorting domain-containing protein, partial [Bacteroidota bacterium]|nr:T9SS type A sorting domain-containing protein [Bacteroidota bacterium]